MNTLFNSFCLSMIAITLAVTIHGFSIMSHDMTIIENANAVVLAGK